MSANITTTVVTHLSSTSPAKPTTSATLSTASSPLAQLVFQPLTPAEIKQLVLMTQQAVATPEQQLPFVVLAPLAQYLQGKYIAVEGLDGSGKSSLLLWLLPQLATLIDIESVREPGGTEVGEELRNILLNKAQYQLHTITELMLFMACRTEILYQKVQPALQAHKVIVSDRCFWSTYAYQAVHNHISIAEFNSLVDLVYKEHSFDLIVYFDVQPEVGLARAAKVGEFDKIESKGLSYLQTTADGYYAYIQDFINNDQSRIIAQEVSWQAYYNTHKSQALVVLDANLTPEAVRIHLVQALLSLYQEQQLN